MKKSILIILTAALPLLAQEAPGTEPQTAPEGAKPAWNKQARPGKGGKRFVEKYDTNKDGQLDDSEKQAMKDAFKARQAEAEAKMAEGRQKFMEKFDANKDGKLDEQEKEAMKMGMKSDMEARRAEMQKKMLEKFDTNGDGQLDEQEKEAMKAKGRGPMGEGKGPGANNKRGHWQGPRTKMPRNPKDAEKAGKPATLEIPQD